MHRLFSTLSAFLIFSLLCFSDATCDVKLPFVDRTEVVTPKTIESPESLYKQALELIAQTPKPDYENALSLMAEVEELYPFSQWAYKAAIVSIYLQYQTKQYAAAEASIEYFLTTYRHYQHLPYALYMRAMVYYKQIHSIQNDHTIALKAYYAFQELVTKHPDSLYAHDSIDRMILTRYYMASEDVEIGRFYTKRHQYLAAISHFHRYLLEYSDTYYTPEVLYRLIFCYTLLGLKQEAAEHYLILVYNFPQSSWIEEAEKILKLKT